MAMSHLADYFAVTVGYLIKQSIFSPCQRRTLPYAFGPCFRQGSAHRNSYRVAGPHNSHAVLPTCARNTAQFETRSSMAPRSADMYRLANG